MSKMKLNNGLFTVTSTRPENEYYKGNYEQFGSSRTSGYIDVKVSETENIKVADVSYEKYMEVINENEMLKKIIVELNKKLYGGQNE